MDDIGQYLGVVGLEGVILDLKEKRETKSRWGLGVDTNNQVQVLAIYQGIKISISMGIRKLVVLGDSSLIIK